MIGRTNAGGGSNNKIPDFSYTGQYQIVQEDKDNWRVLLLTSGTLKFNKLRSAAKGIDIWMCGGGGGGGYHSSTGAGGGGGGYVNRASLIPVVGTSYAATIGAGGSGGKSGSVPTAGGNTTFANTTAKGGGAAKSTSQTAIQPNGGDGGSGGGGSGGNTTTTKAGQGGSNGANGSNRADGGTSGGTGAKANTHMFADNKLPIYCGGGSGGWTGTGTIAAIDESAGYGAGANVNGGNAPANRGGGGGGSSKTTNGGNGGSGVVVFRNLRTGG